MNDHHHHVGDNRGGGGSGRIQNIGDLGSNHHNQHNQRGRPDDHGKCYTGNDRESRNPNENEDRDWRSKSPIALRNYQGNRRDYPREVRQVRVLNIFFHFRTFLTFFKFVESYKSKKITIRLKKL